MKHYSELRKNMTDEQKKASDELYERHMSQLAEQAEHTLRYAKIMGWGKLTKQMQDFIDEHEKIMKENK